MNCDVTYEALAALAAGDLEAPQEAELREHVSQCDGCRQRLASLRKADAALTALPPVQPPRRAILAARQALSEVTRGPRVPEIMTLREVAEFLRITPEQLGEIVEELPAFELAGQIRLRRERLIEWVQQRERDYTRSATAGWVARGVSGIREQGAA